MAVRVAKGGGPQVEFLAPAGDPGAVRELDPAVLQKCIEGCEKMEKTGEDSFDAHLKIGVAGIKGSYVGKIRIVEKEPPESFTLQVEGKGGPGWMKGTARIRIRACVSFAS